MRYTAVRRRELSDRVCGAHTTRAGARHGQVRVHNRVRHDAGAVEFRGTRAGGPRGSQTVADRLRADVGRCLRSVRRVLLRSRRRPPVCRRRPPVGHVVVGAVCVSCHVLGRILAGHRLHTGRVPRRDVPSERAFPLFRGRVHHARVLFVRVQQDFPGRVRPVRAARHVLGFRRRQSDRRVPGAPPRRRDQRQDVLRDPGAARAERERPTRRKE